MMVMISILLSSKKNCLSCISRIYEEHEMHCHHFCLVIKFINTGEIERQKKTKQTNKVMISFLPSSKKFRFFLCCSIRIHLQHGQRLNGPY